MPDEIIIIINEDGTGEIDETFEGDREKSDIEWVSTDSTFTWTICEEYDGQIECDEGPEFKYEYPEKHSYYLNMRICVRNMKVLVCPVMK